MLIRFITAFTRLGRAAGSTEFTLHKQAAYIIDPASVVDDADDLRVWAKEIMNLARLSVAAGSLEIPSFLVIESVANEFAAALDEAVDTYADDGLEDFDDDEPFDDGFFDELDLDMDDDEAELLFEEFWDIIDANFTDDVGTPGAEVAEPAEVEAFLNPAGPLARELAVHIHAVTKESFRIVNERYRHPALRDDSAPESYATEWSERFLAAIEVGSLELARFLQTFTDLCDDTIYLLIAKNAPTTDTFAAHSAEVFARTSRLLAIV